MNELKINPRFKDAIPPLTNEEYENLRESIKSEGCRDAIIIWNGVIVDGHNRYGICTELGILFNTLEKSFENDNDAEEWIMRNQLSRRNLIDVERGRIALRLKELIAARARENQGMRTDLLTNLSKGEVLNTRKEIAKLAGISEGTIAKIEKVDDEAPTPIREAMGRTISIDRAAQFNNQLKQVPEYAREDEAKRLLREAFAEREARIYKEEKITDKLHNIVSAAAIDYEYITEECVDVYIKKCPVSVLDIANSIDDEIRWLLKLKEIFLRRGAELECEGLRNG